MAVYINGVGNISPQKTGGDIPLLSEPCDYPGNRLTCLEPDYTQYLDPLQLRRMSRVIKMGVAAGAMALQEAGIKVPAGIITGTAYGCLEETGVFLGKMIENNERALNPTPFIQSTHNTIGSQIALLMQCQGYNQTYVQGAFSFESALLDAFLELRNNPIKSMLVGGVDEITTARHTIQKRFGVFRTSSGNSLNHLKMPASGIIDGEGAAYFVLSGEKSGASRVVIESIATYYAPKEAELIGAIEQFIKSTSLKIKDLDLILLGKSGDEESDSMTDRISNLLFSSNPIGLFKHLCGEYPTASAFALGLGARIIQEQQIPSVVFDQKISRPLRNVLIYNPYFSKYHSLILLRAC